MQSSFRSQYLNAEVIAVVVIMRIIRDFVVEQREVRGSSSVGGCEVPSGCAGASRVGAEVAEHENPISGQVYLPRKCADGRGSSALLG